MQTQQQFVATLTLRSGAQFVRSFDNLSAAKARCNDLAQLDATTADLFERAHRFESFTIVDNAEPCLYVVQDWDDYFGLDWSAKESNQTLDT